MAFVSRSAIRNATNFSDYLLRSFSTSTKSAHHNNHQQTHKYLEANAFVGSWEAPKDPKEAQARLALLRRDYAKKVKQVRKNYIQEGELLRLEKQRKDEAKQEALRVVNEERKKLKAEAAKARAEERKVANEEFRQTLFWIQSLLSDERTSREARALENDEKDEGRKEERKERANKTPEFHVD
ncbi:uncharacterized protein LOC111799790 isoform X2 [Cucurbita pepo subsp. pepo]|uniref:uncharacterized protein LOC111799790 isoform X2 n=1 Tax=Cucurbita pepo subsp. pepo TaxID=3664 RepID=UPI000C9D2E51|nr:uncharacterized protein LOC111799790 isoform X2 [Cucurbita pepo subsp. pepo]